MVPTIYSPRDDRGLFGVIFRILAKMAPGWPKRVPRWHQEGPKWSQDGAKRPQDGPRWRQDGSTMAPRDGSERGLRRRKGEPRHPKIAKTA